VGPRAGVENLASTGIRSLDRPACIESLYRLRRPSPPFGMHGCKWKLIILNETLSPVFLIHSTAEEFLKQFFISRGNITYGNVYRPRTRTHKQAKTHTYKRLSVAHGYYSSIANSWKKKAIFRGKLEILQHISKFLCIYFMISRGIFVCKHRFGLMATNQQY
jgi:hypothetical protein